MIRLWPGSLNLSMALLIWPLLPVSSWGQASEPVLEQLKFTAVELLIYTDQLRRFEETHCSRSVVSAYDLSASQQQLLAKLKPEHRPEFKQLFGSDKMARLLQENTAGIDATLGPAQLMGLDGATHPEQLAACRELGAVFQDNYLQTEQDLEQLFERYRQSRAVGD